jgi:pimeloyl-ACP methyl ester carboxylesterase
MNQYLTRKRLSIAGATLLVLAVIYVGLSWYVVDQALQAKVIAFEYHPDDLGMTYEEVEFSPRGDDSITLRGWWLPAQDPLATLVWSHGLDHTRAERLPLMQKFVDFGFSVLVYDFRGHGESDHVATGAGFHEINDLDGAIDFVLANKGAEPGKVLLMGQSFGAAVTIMAGFDEPAVVGVFADSPFAALEDVMIGEIEKRTPFPSFVAEALRPGILRMGDLRGINIPSVRPEVFASQYTLPIALAHCQDDERIPIEHTIRIRSVAPGGVWMNLYPRCGHAEAYDDFPEQFFNVATNYFLDRLDLLEAPPEASS